MKHLCTILATVFAAAFTASAKTFDWPIDSPAAKAAQFTAYHGETVRFNLRLGGAMTNLSPVAIYYQTNGMGKAEWFGPIPGTVFRPTNDCGAAAYRFFILCNDPDGKDYTANGSLRLLDSPGFEPSAVQLPVRTLDFAEIEVLNPPWGEGPGNYAAVSNAAMTAAQTATNLVAAATNGIPTRADLDKGWWSEWSCNPATLNGVPITIGPGVGDNEYAPMVGDVIIGNPMRAIGPDGSLRWLHGEWNGEGELVATRHRVAAPVPTKPEDIGAASTNDVQLKPVLSQTPTFSEWTVLRGGVDVTSQVEQPYWDEQEGWRVPVLIIDSETEPTAPGTADASSLTWAATYDSGDDVFFVTYTATRTRTDVVGYTLGSQTNKVIAATNGVLRTESDPTVPVWAKSAQKPKYTSSEVGAYPNASGEQLSAQVSAIGTYLNAEDARFVSTNYDSVVRMPEAYVEVRLNDHGTNVWTTIWQEMRRWNAFTGLDFDWNTWNGFRAFLTNVTTELAFKADRAWGAYDSETGGYSPEGYTQISSSNILIAAGMAYQRTVTTDGNVWVLQCNQGTAHIGGDTNGFFRVVDGDGVTQFEIIKGDRREMGADASGITVSAGNVMTIPYSVEAAEHPTISCCNNLPTANWKDESDADCLCTVSWSGSSGAWVATVTPKTAQPSMFVKATFMAGGETYIRNVAPVSMDSIMLNGTKYYLGTATMNGHTVLTLSTTP